jgi:hypothetical protein
VLRHSPALLSLVRGQQLGHQFFTQGFFVQVIVFIQPLLNRQGLWRDVGADGGVEHVLTEISDGLANIVGGQQRFC